MEKRRTLFGEVLLLLFVLEVSDSAFEKPVLNKCCNNDEVLIEDKCRVVNKNLSWSPKFVEQHQSNQLGDIELVIGYPKCSQSQLWTVFNSDYDRLRFLSDGTLRHYLTDSDVKDEDLKDEKLFYDYKQGSYCSDKRIDANTTSLSDMYFALVCVPYVKASWSEVDFILRKVIDPIFHITSLICYVTVAQIHFVLPQLRDLFGNIVATVNICLAVAQAADTARIITNFGLPWIHFIADVTLCVCVLSAYLWLTGLGFYLWRTFRSENVFLRMTHGKKYCYYSCCIWSMTVFMTFIALLAHFYLDHPLEDDVSELMKIGGLVIAIFYLPIACCLIVNAFFYHTTSSCMKVYGRYGKVHHIFKICVEIFGRLYLAMSVYWAFLALSWLPFNGVYYSYIIVNGAIAPVILYISVLSQKRVRFLLRKEYCFEKCFCRCLRPNQPDDIPEWGEEMLAIYR